MRKIVTFGALLVLVTGCSREDAKPSTHEEVPARSAVSALSSGGAQTTAPRTPVGVFAQIDSYDAHNQGYTAPGALKTLVMTLAADPAIAGIWLGVHWADLSPTDPGPDAGPRAFTFDMIQETLDGLEAVNDAAPKGTPRKTLVLSLAPGFYSPDWMFGPNHLSQCDGYFCSDQPAPDSGCGYVTFDDYPEKVDGGPTKLPLPWSQDYQSSYAQVLGAIAAAYSSRTELVGLQIAGPTGASPEMILPNTVGPDAGDCHHSAMDMWPKLINPAAPDSHDDVFVTAWRQAIQLYNQSFSGVTLILTPDSGMLLPNLPLASPPGDASVYGTQCVATMGTPEQRGDYSCQAVSEIVDYFLTVNGHDNALATHFGGLLASSPTTFTAGDMAMTGVKALTVGTSSVGGGAELDHALTSTLANLDAVGCPDGGTCAPMTVELALFNALATFFEGTYGQPTVHPVGVGTKLPPNPARLGHLAIRFEDVLYAEGAEGFCNPIPFQAVPNASAHYLMALANSVLSGAQMGNAPVKPPTPVPPTCRSILSCSQGGCPPGLTCSGGQCVVDCSGNTCK